MCVGDIASGTALPSRVASCLARTASTNKRHLGGRDGGGDSANGIGLTTSELIRQAFILRRKIDNVEVRRALEMKRLRRTASTDALYAPPDAPDGEGEAAS